MVTTFACSFCLAFALTASAPPQPAPLRQPPPQVRPPERATLLDRFFAPDENPLVQDRALRRLTASTRGGHLSATMDVWTTLDPVHGFTFQVVSESGLPLIRRKVLLAALEAEQKSQTVSDREEAALTAANYEFQNVGTATQHIVKVDLQPRRKHVMRVNGSIFLEEESADLVRIEGELSKRPVFLDAKGPDSTEVQPNRRGSRSRRDALDSRLLVVGASSFSMTYTYAEINGQPVHH